MRPSRIFRTRVTTISMIVGVLAGSLAITFCDRMVGPGLPSDAEQFFPPAVFSTWWNMTQACSGVAGLLGAVTWYKTTGLITDPHTGNIVVGSWFAGSNSIVLNEGSIQDGGTVRHEMLHALLRKGGHPRSQFLGKCAGTVDCYAACVLDAEPYSQPPERPIQIQLDPADIMVDIEPKKPSFGIDGGFFSITVTAHNRETHWATVAPISPTTSPNATFSYDARGVDGSSTNGESAFDPSEIIFAPGETKKRVFDFVVGDLPFGRHLPAGNYLVRGGFSDFWSGDSTLVIGQ